MRDLALRATHWQQLYDPVLPGFFLAWAKRNDIDYPAELENQVVARGQQIADWKSRYDGLQAQFNDAKAHYDDYAAKVQAVLDEDKNLIDGLAAERDSLRSRVARFRNVRPGDLPDLNRKAIRWAVDNLISLRDASLDVSVPESLHDRAADNWEFC